MEFFVTNIKNLVTGHHCLNFAIAGFAGSLCSDGSILSLNGNTPKILVLDLAHFESHFYHVWGMCHDRGMFSDTAVYCFKGCPSSPAAALFCRALHDRKKRGSAAENELQRSPSVKGASSEKKRLLEISKTPLLLSAAANRNLVVEKHVPIHVDMVGIIPAGIE